MSGKDYILPSAALACVIALIVAGPIPQDQYYHQFADQRLLWGIPNFLNVITNLPFAVVGFLGLLITRRIMDKELRHICFILFTAFFLVSIGSGYYHLLPGNTTLVYDRIPIAMILMSFFALIIHDCIRPIKGHQALIVLNTTGLLSVIYWAFSEHNGDGDLRWYGMVQFFPVIAIPIMLGIYKPAFNYWKDIIFIFLFFAIARVCEMLDKNIYEILGETISGHSLKHIFMSVAGYKILILVRRRSRPVIVST